MRGTRAGSGAARKVLVQEEGRGVAAARWVVAGRRAWTAGMKAIIAIYTAEREWDGYCEEIGRCVYLIFQREAGGKWRTKWI